MYEKERIKYYLEFIYKKLDALHDKNVTRRKFDTETNQHKEVQQYDKSDTERIDKLLELQKRLSDGDTLHFEMAYPKYTERITKRLTEEFGTIYKYKSGEPVEFVKNMLFAWREQTEKDSKSALTRSKESADLFLRQHDDLIDRTLTDHKLRTLKEIKQHTTEKNAACDRYLYDGRPKWGKDIDDIETTYNKEANLKYFAETDEAEKMRDRNRLFYATAEDELKDSLKEFCDSRIKWLEDSVERTTDKEKIKNDVHTIEDDMKEFELGLNESITQKTDKQTDDICNASEERMYRFRNSLVDLEEARKNALEKTQREHYQAAQAKFNEKKQGPHKG